MPAVASADRQTGHCSRRYAASQNIQSKRMAVRAWLAAERSAAGPEVDGHSFPDGEQVLAGLFEVFGEIALNPLLIVGIGRAAHVQGFSDLPVRPGTFEHSKRIRRATRGWHRHS